MQWRGRRTSRNIEDRRGQGRTGGRMRMGGGGGLGIGATIIVLLLGAYFGVDVTPFLGGGGGSVATAPAPSGPNQIDDDTEAFVATILAETETTWSEIFEASGRRYEPTTLVLYQGGTASGCGMADSAMGPFYCPGDHRVYLDTSFFRVMEQQLGARGDFAQAYVIAHEVAHHVQNLLGVLGEVHEHRQHVSEREANALTVRIELQADCYAGLWARASREELSVTQEDIREALDTAARIGDDALQRAAGRQVVPDSFTHGSSEQRQRWFFQGYQTGDPNACDTFNARSL